MWKYNEITRKAFEERKDFVEGILREFGADSTDLGYSRWVSNYGSDVSETVLTNRIVFEYKHKYYRVDEVLFSAKPFIVIEYTDNIEYVLNNTMEDTDPFPYDLSDNEIREEVKNLLIKSP